MHNPSELKFRIFDIIQRLKLGFPCGGYPYNRNEEYSPFFIVGSGRSGNTLLRRILNNHSDIYIPPETYVLGNIIRRFRSYRGMDWKFLTRLVYSIFEYHHEFHTFGISSLRRIVLEMEAIPKNQRTVAALIDRFYRYYAEIHGINKKRWGDKSPMNTFSVFRINKVFPNAKYINMIRNPFDVCYSYINSGIYQKYGDAACRWTQSILIIDKFKRKHKETVLDVHYEDLVSNTKEAVKMICSFLNIDFEKEMLKTGDSDKLLGDVEKYKHHENVLNPINMKSIGKGIKYIGKDELKIINAVISTVKKEKYER